MRKEILLPALAVVGGGAGFALRTWQLSAAFDETTLLFRSGAPSTMALLILLTAAAAGLLLLVLGVKAPRQGAEAFFCPETGYMTLMTAAGFLWIAAGLLGFLEMRTQLALWRMQTGLPFPLMLLLTALLCLPAGAGALMLGKGNYRCTRPAAYPLLATLPAYALLPWLVAVYQINSRQPALMLFAITMVGVVCAELGLYMAACFAFDRPKPRLCIYFSLLAVVLLLTSLADRPGLFTAVMSMACVLLLLAQSWALLRGGAEEKKNPEPAQEPQESDR